MDVLNVFIYQNLLYDKKYFEFYATIEYFLILIFLGPFKINLVLVILSSLLPF